MKRDETVAERISYFCLARNLIRSLGSTHIFTQSGWLILIQSVHLSGQAQTGESRQTLSLSQNFFVQDRRNDWPLSWIAASCHYEESRLIYGPLASILWDQGFPVEYELDEFNTPHTGTTFSCLQYWLCRLRCKNTLRHRATSSLGNIFWIHSRFSPKQPEPQINGWLQHFCPQTVNTTFATLWRTYLPHTFNNALT